MTDAATKRRLPGFYYRFAHPALAAVANVGVVLWFVGFAVAGSGVVVQNSRPALSVWLFHYGALAGLLGLLVVAAVVVYLLALWVLRDVIGVLDWEKPEPGARR